MTIFRQDVLESVDKCGIYICSEERPYNPNEHNGEILFHPDITYDSGEPVCIYCKLNLESFKFEK